MKGDRAKEKSVNGRGGRTRRAAPAHVARTVKFPDGTVGGAAKRAGFERTLGIAPKSMPSDLLRGWTSGFPGQMRQTRSSSAMVLG